MTPSLICESTIGLIFFCHIVLTQEYAYWSTGPARQSAWSGRGGSMHEILVLGCFVHVCFVQVTILNIVWRSQCSDAARCAHFSIDIFLCDPRRCDNSSKVRALRNVGSATHCHLYKTDMDKTSQHPSWVKPTRRRRWGLNSRFICLFSFPVIRPYPRTVGTVLSLQYN